MHSSFAELEGLAGAKQPPSSRTALETSVHGAELEGDEAMIQFAQDRVQKALECHVQEFNLVLWSPFPSTTCLIRTALVHDKTTLIPGPNSRCKESKYRASDRFCMDCG